MDRKLRDEAASKTTRRIAIDRKLESAKLTATERSALEKERRAIVRRLDRIAVEASRIETEKRNAKRDAQRTRSRKRI